MENDNQEKSVVNQSINQSIKQ